MGVVISASIAARGLKFWLQVALSAPIATAWTQIRKFGSGSRKSGFSGKKISLFFASTDPLGPQGHSPEVPVPPNPDPDPVNPVFPENFFSLFLASTASWDLRVTPRMDRNHLIRIRIREIRFFRKSGFFVFSTF